MVVNIKVKPKNGNEYKYKNENDIKYKILKWI